MKPSVFAPAWVVTLLAAGCQTADRIEDPIEARDAATLDASGLGGEVAADSPAQPDLPAQPADAGGVEAKGADGPLPDAGASPDGAAGTFTQPMVCGAAEVLPPFDRSCANDRDCVAVTTRSTAAEPRSPSV
jgi:hypothetical protein